MYTLVASIDATFLIWATSEIVERMRSSPYSADESGPPDSGYEELDTNPSNPAISQSSSAMWGVIGIMLCIHTLRASLMVASSEPPRLTYHLRSLNIS